MNIHVNVPKDKFENISMEFDIIYKKATNGKHINQWMVEVLDNKFRTISGYYGMKLTTSEWTVCEGKNIGKANETTPHEQAILQAKALHNKKLESGYVTNVNDCERNKYFEPMLAQDWHDRKDKVKYPIFSQPKLDGIRNVTTIKGMHSRNGKEILSAPHIYEVLKPLFEKYPDLILDGELYADKFATDFNAIVSLVRKTKPTTDDLEKSKMNIQYHVYDIPSVNDVFSKRYDALKELLDGYHEYIVVVDTKLINDPSEVNDAYEQYIEKNMKVRY